MVDGCELMADGCELKVTGFELGAVGNWQFAVSIIVVCSL